MAGKDVQESEARLQKNEGETWAKSLALRSKWFRIFGPRFAPMRLICFPFAGGSASLFCRWPQILSNVQVIGVELPGRGTRITESPFTELRPIVSSLRNELSSFLDQPFMVFGHSMGALIAYELSRQLIEPGWPSPLHLFVSARSAPHLPSAEKQHHLLSDQCFLEELMALGGTPPEFLRHEELTALLLPALKADFQVCETYHYLESPPLSCPITVFGGRNDEIPEGDLREWSKQTIGRFDLKILPGGHFFICDRPREVLDTINQTIKQEQLGSSLMDGRCGYSL